MTPEKQAEHRLSTRNYQYIADRFFGWEQAQGLHPSAPPKIVCRHCGKGPLGGDAIKKVTWSCLQHPIRVRL